MGMTVKAAAEAAGVSPKAVRLWESKGQLPPAERTEGADAQVPGAGAGRRLAV